MGPLHLAIVLGCAALISAAQEPEPVKCPTIETIAKFDVDKYVGLWYEIQTIPNERHLPGKCVSARYTVLNNETIEVINSMCYLDNKVSIVGNANEETTGSEENGKLSVSFPIMGPKSKSPYYVLYTDYDTYSIVYSCQESTDPQKEPEKNLWVLGKETTFNNTQKAAVAAKLKELKMNTEDLKNTDQSNCCYDATKYDDGNSAVSAGLSMALLLSTVMVRFL